MSAIWARRRWRACEQATATDATHDRRARGLFQVLSGLADLVEDPDEAAAARAARDQIAPNGMLSVNASYTDEAGQASLVDQRLSAASKKFLDATTVGNKTLAGWVSSWKEAAQELGAIEALRVTTAGDAAEKPGSLVVQARNQWIRVFYAVTNMITLEKVSTGRWTAIRRRHGRRRRRPPHPPGRRLAPQERRAAMGGSPPITARAGAAGLEGGRAPRGAVLDLPHRAE